LRVPLKLGLLLIASLAAVLIAAALPDSILAGDTENFRDRMELLFDGRVPYFEFDFEHQPVMLIPLALPWLLGGDSSLPAYVIAFAALTFLYLAGILVILERAARRLGDPVLGVRWLALMIPMLPLALFRNDAFSVLLTLGAILWAMAGREGASLLTAVAGVLTKVWTAALLPINWWRGKRRASVLLGVAAVSALVINFSPPVQAIQESAGLHTETLSGSVIGFARLLQGLDLGLSRGATAYIAAPRFALLVNIACGGAVVLVARKATRHKFDWYRAWMVLGALTASLIVASPFLSPQYLIWLFPFLAIRRGWTMAGSLLGMVTMAMALGWFEQFQGTFWWWGAAVVRNVGLVSLALTVAVSAGRDRVGVHASGSRHRSATPIM
jgi:hypothetical protein